MSNFFNTTRSIFGLPDFASTIAIPEFADVFSILHVNQEHDIISTASAGSLGRILSIQGGHEQVGCILLGMKDTIGRWAAEDNVDIDLAVFVKLSHPPSDQQMAKLLPSSTASGMHVTGVLSLHVSSCSIVSKASASPGHILELLDRYTKSIINIVLERFGCLVSQIPYERANDLAAVIGYFFAAQSNAMASHVLCAPPGGDFRVELHDITIIPGLDYWVESFQQGPRILRAVLSSKSSAKMVKKTIKEQNNDKVQIVSDSCKTIKELIIEAVHVLDHIIGLGLEGIYTYSMHSNHNGGAAANIVKSLSGGQAELVGEIMHQAVSEKKSDFVKKGEVRRNLERKIEEHRQRGEMYIPGDADSEYFHIEQAIHTFETFTPQIDVSELFVPSKFSLQESIATQHALYSKVAAVCAALAEAGGSLWTSLPYTWLEHWLTALPGAARFRELEALCPSRVVLIQTETTDGEAK